MKIINNYETIELIADAVVERECVNSSDRAYAVLNVMNIGDSDVLINTTGDFTDGKYITLPSNTAVNGKKIRISLKLYFKSDSADGKVVVNID